MSQYFGEVDVLISHKRHKIIKLTLPKTKMQCLKIFTFPKQHASIVQLYKDHFQNVKEWIKNRYSGRSLLKTIDIIQTKEEIRMVEVETKKQVINLKIKTEYYPHSTIDFYYQKLAQNINRFPLLPNNINIYIYFIQQFFETVLRGASIKNFFYSPSNLYINRPQPLLPDVQIAKITVNYLSTVGLELLYSNGSIIREDLYEIYPLLPSNLQALMPKQQKEYKQYMKEVNRIIRLKALGWNILSFILRYVPNMLKLKKDLNEKIIHRDKVLLLLRQQKDIYVQLIKRSEKQIENATDITGIDFTWIFKEIFANNCEKVTWQDLYRKLFLENKIATMNKQAYARSHGNGRIPHGPSDQISQKILKGFWLMQDQKVREYYLQQSIPPQSTVYFLIRTNITFRKMMRHINILYFFDQEPFSSDLLEVHLAFMRNSFKNVSGIQLKDIVIPYRHEIPLPPSPQKNIAFSYVSAANICKGLSRVVQTNDKVQKDKVQKDKVQIKLRISHEIQNSINILMRNEWRHY